MPVEEWAALVEAADSAGESVGLFAARVIRENVETRREPRRYTGMWGAEASMPREPDTELRAPTTPLLARAFGGISTQSEVREGQGLPDHRAETPETPEIPYTPTESGEIGEIGPDPARSARIAALMADIDP